MPSADANTTPAATLTLPEDELDDLLYAARTGDLPIFTETLNALSASLNHPASTILLQARDPHSGNSAAHFAAANGHIEVLQHIFTCAEPEVGAAPPLNPQTPQPAADPSSPNTTPLATTTSPTPLLALLSNAPNNQGNTPLHYAALTGQLAAVRLLVETGAADPAARNAAGHGPVFEAERAEKGAVVEFLLGVVGVGGGAGVEREGEVDADVDGDAEAEAELGNGVKSGEQEEELVEGVRRVGVGEAETGGSGREGG